MIRITKDKTQQEGMSLPELTEMRVRQGFAPPPEAYLVQNRDKIDWAGLPAWTHPVDPEAFDGCSHEG